MSCFPSYVRSEINWKLNNFTPELLRNPHFFNFDSPEFTVRLGNCSYKNITKWKLSVYRNQSSLSVYIKKIDSSEYYSYKNYDNLSVDFSVGLRNIDGTISNQTKGHFDRIWYSERMGRLINYKELASHTKKWKVLDNKKLTIVVRLDFIEKPKTSSPVNPMSKQYEKLFNNEKFSDFILITSEEKEIPVHKNILSIRSPVFETMMETKMLESKQGKATIDDISGKALMEFLRFVYCGRVENIDDVASELVYAASKYDLPDLKPLCVASLTSKLTLENVIDTMMLADLHGENSLKNYCIDFIKWHYIEMKEAEGWKQVPQSLYKDILDSILPASTESIVNLDSKVTVAPLANQLNATVNAAP